MSARADSGFDGLQRWHTLNETLDDGRERVRQAVAEYDAKIAAGGEVTPADVERMRDAALIAILCSLLEDYTGSSEVRAFGGFMR